MTSETTTQRLDFDTPALLRKRRLRAFKDRLTRWYVTVGGLAVLGAITLIFFYLAGVVAPLFGGAELQAHHNTRPAWIAEEGKPLLLSVEEQNRIGMRVGDGGVVQFFELESGEAISSQQLPLPEGTGISSLAEDLPGSHRFALGLSNGQVLVVEHKYKVTWPDNVKTITPQLAYPFGEQPIVLDVQGRALDRLAINHNGSTLLLGGVAGGELQVLEMEREENLFTGETSLNERRIALPQPVDALSSLHFDPRQLWLFAITDKGVADVYDLRKKSLNGHYPLVKADERQVSVVHPLLGGVSLMVGDSKGGIGQWFMVRDEHGVAKLTLIRSFQLADNPVQQILPEERRKGFIGVDSTGQVGLFHSTAHRTLLVEKLGNAVQAAALSPRADVLLLEEGGQLKAFEVHNPHPEVSWSALWNKVWYENYDQPDYVWQSTSASTDNEPKLSLAPLAFGTLKAAFYAMMLAAPLAICAAIYTAYFMAPSMRSKVKPVIELMEALPTVILGFFAGLFLAPYVEGHLPGIFSLLLLTPVGIILASWLWCQLPEHIRLRVPDGWEAALLIPVILLVGTFALSMSGHLENWFFGGDMRLWLSNDLGIPFDQRNALVVGLAMGFAVIPNIYSIAEDAVFSVPRSLTLGSLALGATPWQTMTRVVILTASPGIFSALMIGMGRAVGETMIVLMATGNTPIMEANIFEGLRTLAANVAVEMPESEVGSTHYRVLFLSAMVLLLFTFVMNTGAELIRTRLRKKYASL